MAEFLTTYGISYNIESIIMDARTHLTLVSPYLQISKTLMERLKDASNKRVSIKIVYGKDDLRTNERESLMSLHNLELFYFDNLHAKCYFNENKMVITSMNMYEFSEKNNREMGVLIDKFEDRKLYEKAVSETNSILQSAEEIKFKKSMKSKYPLRTTNNLKLTKELNAHCIRCKDKIEINPDMPYCEECFEIWDSYSNYEYKENYCHNCGSKANTSMQKPQCFTCFSVWIRE
ncbi:MAG: phospholipase D-like domain-containing protein [Bacteroidota bacterium]|nr:phospholipase D-like domain-containing protein [Bacteroidota bacterium]